MITALIILGLVKMAEKWKRRREPESGSRLENRPWIFIIIFLMPTALAMAQTSTMTYEIRKNNKVIGSLEVTKNEQGELTAYMIESEIRVRILLLKYRINLHHESIYRQGVLASGFMIKRVNGNERAYHTFERDSAGYRITRDHEMLNPIEFPIRYSTPRLYFEEPITGGSHFSDGHLDFVTTIATGPHTYRVELPDGVKSYYTYVNGVCTQVEIHHTLATVQIVLTSKEHYYADTH